MQRARGKNLLRMSQEEKAGQCAQNEVRREEPQVMLGVSA